MNIAYSQSIIQAYSDASLEILVHKVPVNVLGSSLNPIEVKNKSVRGIQEVIVKVECDCDKGPSASQRVYFNKIEGYSSGKDIISHVDCKGIVNGCIGSVISLEMEKDKATAKKDDFWSGKKAENKSDDQTNTIVNNSKGNFWDGGQSTTNLSEKSEVQDNFWGGKGDDAEEKYFETHTTPKESNQFIGEIESRTKTITIMCRDHGTEDGDRVKIMHNNEIVQSNLYLTNAVKRFEITLGFGMNRIEFEALNQGSAGPNTAEFKVYDDSGRQISSKEWNILTGYSATLLVLKL